MSDRRTANWDLSAGVDNYLALAGGQIASALLSFWALSIVSHALEATGYGTIVAILALSQAVAQVTLHWSVLSLYRHGCEEFVETGRLASAFWTRTFILLACCGALAASAPLWFGSLLRWFEMPREAAWLVPVHVFSSAVSIHVHHALLAAKEPRFQSLALVLSRSLLVAALLLSSEELSWRTIAILYAVAPLLEAVVGIVRLRPLIYPGIGVDRPLLQKMLGFSLPLTVHGILGYLSTNYLDAFFILKLRSAAELGVYALAYQLVGAFMQMATVGGSLLLSLFVTLGLEGKTERTATYFRELLPVLALLWSGACIGFALGGSVLIRVFFGPSFSASSALLWPLSAAAALAGPVFLGFGPLIHARSVTFISAYLAGASALVNVVLNALWIPRFGLAGCAWATVAAYGASTVVAVALSRKLVGARLRWYLAPLAPAVLAAALAAASEPILGAAAGLAALVGIAFVRRTEVERGLVRLSRLATGGMAEGPVERFEPGLTRDAWRGIHLARYNFAAPYVLSGPSGPSGPSGRAERVLDIACGSGYGLPVLEATGAAVVGVDLDSSALRKARGSVSMPALLSADASRLPFADGAFGVVTSFETLEHLERRREFVDELRRVLRRDGLLILSTPNANVTEPVDGRPRNPHHLHEYRPSELKAELEAAFGDVAILGQVLDPRFQISPFRDAQHRLPRTIAVQARLLLWRILYKLPEAPQNLLSRILFGHPLIAGERDYQFRPDALDCAPVLVALCRGYARGMP